ncbi:MAG: GNAT family N-acetyltransferase [Candidatus Firestonebacteria bacterium]
MIRVCKKKEYVTLVEILRDSFAIGSIDKRIEDKFGKIIGFDWWERKSADIIKEAKANPSGVFVYEIDGKIAAFMTTYMDEKFSYGKVFTLAVVPKHQGKGLGTLLLKYAEKVFKKNKMKLMRINVLEDNPRAYELYKKLGFEPAGQIVNMGKKLEN